MSATEMPQKTKAPQIVKLSKALKMAEEWLNNMTNTTDDEATAVVPENRPPRLGLGAKVTPQFGTRPSNDPLHRKLCAKFDVGKRQAAKKMEDAPPLDNVDVEDDDEESRTAMFAKKRGAATLVNMPFQARKKRK